MGPGFPIFVLESKTDKIPKSHISGGGGGVVPGFVQYPSLLVPSFCYILSSTQYGSPNGASGNHKKAIDEVDEIDRSLLLTCVTEQ